MAVLQDVDERGRVFSSREEMDGLPYGVEE